MSAADGGSRSHNDGLGLLGQRLGFRRMERGRSVRELAIQTGISRAQIAAIEAGRTQPSVGDLIRLAQVLTSDVTEWLRLAGYSPPPITSSEPYFWLGESSAATRLTQPSLFRDIEQMEKDGLDTYITHNRKLVESPALIFLRDMRTAPDLRIVGVSHRAGRRLGKLYRRSGRPVTDFLDNEGTPKWAGLKIGIFGWLMKPTLLLLAALEHAGQPRHITFSAPAHLLVSDPDAVAIDVAYSVGALIDRLRRDEIDLALFPTVPYFASLYEFRTHCAEVPIPLASIPLAGGGAMPFEDRELPVTLVVTKLRYLAGSAEDSVELLIDLDRIDNACRAARDDTMRSAPGLGLPPFEDDVQITDANILVAELLQVDNLAREFGLYTQPGPTRSIDSVGSLAPSGVRATIWDRRRLSDLAQSVIPPYNYDEKDR